MNNRDILVTIGLPVYNGENFLESTLESILSQTHTNLEVIISDNASTDNTGEICRKYVEKDKRISYYKNHENVGAAKNYNIVAELANGKYFKWAAHDDMFAPEFIEKCLAVLEKSDDIVLCYSEMVFIDSEGNELERISNELFFESDSPSQRYSEFLKKFRHTTKYCDPIFGLINTKQLKKTKLIGNYPTSDMNLLAELLLLGKFYELDECLFFRRKHDQMSTKAHASNMKRAVWFDPTNQNKILLTKHRWLVEFLSSIKRVPLDTATKIKCYFETFKWSMFRAKGFAADLIYAGKHLVFKNRDKE
jgi:glycosyltransferase involved in cell wall biosynthesis